MPQRKRAHKTAKHRANADRLVTIAVIAFLVLVVGGAVALQLSSNLGSARTPGLAPQSSTTVTSPGSIQRIAVSEAKQRIDAGQAVLVDTRSATSYQSEHATGAVSFPEGDEAASFGRLPMDKALIFYCT